MALALRTVERLSQVNDASPYISRSALDLPTETSDFLAVMRSSAQLAIAQELALNSLVAARLVSRPADR